MLELVSFIWNTFLINPMVNCTIVLDRILFNNYGLAIIVFTLIMRALTLPLTLRQIYQQRHMSQLQPQLSEIQKKYKDPKKRSEETMKLYKEAGTNPAGCLLPMLIQFPLWIALYNVIRDTVGPTPQALIDLSGRLYPWSLIQQAVPIGDHFLIWNMGLADASYVLPVLVGGSMWLQQKLTMTQASMTSANQTQAQTNQMMLMMMPLMFGYFTLSVPSGLAIYWLISNVVGIIMNYFVFGWRGTDWKQIFMKPAGPTPPRGGQGAGRNGRADRGRANPLPAPALSVVESDPAEGSRMEKRDADGRDGRGRSKRKDGRRGNRPGAQPARPGPQPGRGGDS